MNINFTLFAQAIAFAAFIWFTVRFVWPPLLAAIEERQKKIAEGLAAADKGAKSLEEAQVRITALVEDARGQARQILDQAQARANGIVEEARASADQERERIIQSAKAEVDQQVNKARDELRGQVAAIAVAGAEKILAREIDARTHQDLLNKLAAQI
jgi:F-type H+-transporting ATPase subunit b